jgi:DNA-nicking Smr family endonuclease
VDLHGLLLPEAIAVVERTLQAIRDEYRATGPEGKLLAIQHGHAALEIVTGRGAHSEGHAVLKPAIQEYLTQSKIIYAEKNEGSLIVRLKL